MKIFHPQRLIEVTLESSPTRSKKRPSLFRMEWVSPEGEQVTFEFEKEVWLAIEEITIREQCTFRALCEAVNHTNFVKASMNEAMDHFIFDYFRSAATSEGHAKAGHGKLQTDKNVFEKTLH